jgi:hypothetical protein
MRLHDFGDTAPCSLVDSDVLEEHAASSDLKMETPRSSETW